MTPTNVETFEPSAMTAYHSLRRWIVEGDLQPGERIVETRMAELLEVSRTPVREALRMLQSEGLVEFEPNRGAKVRPLSVADISDLYELRARLESMAAEFAAVRITDDEKVQLVAAATAFADAVDDAAGGTIAAIRHLAHCNDNFHLTLLASAHHERLTQTLIRTVDHPLVFQALRRYTRDGLERSAVFHRLIADAVIGGDGARAARLTHEHVMQGCDELVAAVGDDATVSSLFERSGPFGEIDTSG